MSLQILVSLQVMKLPIIRPVAKTTSPKLTELDETPRTGAAASAEKLLIYGETAKDVNGSTNKSAKTKEFCLNTKLYLMVIVYSTAQ